MTIIREARLIAAGDPAVGIPDHEILVDHIDLDLGVFEKDDLQPTLSELCRGLAIAGNATTGERVTIHLGYSGDGVLLDTAVSQFVPAAGNRLATRIYLYNIEKLAIEG